MKSLLFIIVLAFAFTFTSCTSENLTDTEELFEVQATEGNTEEVKKKPGDN